MNKSDSSLVPIPLQTALELYRKALEGLESPKTSTSSEQAFKILWARDALQRQLEAEQEIPTDLLPQLIQLDTHLKQQAYKITQVIDLSEYRDTLPIANQAWWWNLESRECLHPWNRFDWLVRGGKFVLLSVNFTLIGTIATRFLSGGSGFVEIAALVFPAMVSLLQAQNALTDARQKGFSKLMNKLKIPQHLYEEVQLLTTVIITLSLLGIWTNFPAFSEIYKREGKKYQDNQQLAQAEQNYLKAIELEPDNLDAHFKLATLYEELQDFDNAKKQYLIAAKGGYLDAYNNLAYWYIRENKDGGAVELLEKGKNLLAEKDKKLDQLTEDEKRNLEVQKYSIYKNIGWARFKQNRNEDAIYNLLIAIGIAKNPDNEKYIRNPGAAYCIYAQVLQKQEERSSQAKQYWQQCRQLIESRTGPIMNTEEDKWLYEAKKQLQ